MQPKKMQPWLCWLTDLELLWHRLARSSPQFRRLLVTRSAVESYFFHRYGTSQKLVPFPVVQRQILLQSRHTILFVPTAFPYHSDCLRFKPLSNVICPWLSIPSSFNLWSANTIEWNLFNCVGCSDFNWVSRSFDVSCACVTITMLTKPTFFH